MFCLIMILTAGGASPLATQHAKIGPYQLLLSYYSLPRAGQALSNEEIEVVQRGRSNADAYFARVGSGSIGHICDVELVDSAGGGEHAGAQGERR